VTRNSLASKVSQSNRMKSRMLKSSFLLVILGLLFSISSAQQAVTWTSHLVSGEAKSAANVVVELDATIGPKWHLYALPPTKASNIPTTVSVNAPANGYPREARA